MKNIDFFIGIDGGGTKSVGCLVDVQGHLLATAITGPTNYLRKDEQQIIGRILKLVDKLCSQVGCVGKKPRAMAVALSGLGTQQTRTRIRRMLDKNQCAATVIAESDAAAALAGAFAGQPGAILIAGTGSIAFGKSAMGRVYRAGGWGYLLGAEGAGFDIGRNGVAAALEDWDGRGEKTVLRPQLETFFQVKSINEAVPEIYVNYTTRGALAQFAPFVFEAAKAGDSVALQIIETAAGRLAEHITALAPRLDKNRTVQLALLGNIFKSKKLLLPTMHRCWQAADCNVQIIEPRFPAEIGAIFLAAPEKVQLKDFLENLKASYGEKY